ncbi:DNA double-strand break repair protein Mre11 [Sulfuracidifex metallicus]|uniref:DNA double-strand break repair protein Mre11 n=1 Tax=Sulfuracidifex metallicus TaxID=47303 RepID=UPI002272447E|nr:DNA double-strand break repair protein Mre11 [Sulfuracidifex metallicus]MCY0849501.1 DNA double-strand break repair protein Mre11 [Sulfuracidifex metallicus]
MQLLHISDTHLGKRQYGLEERESDVYETFSNLIDLAIQERVKAVVHTGDLFDQPNPPNNAIYHALTEIKRLTEKGIMFLNIPGDHDTPKRNGEKYPQKILEIAGLKLLNDSSITLEDCVKVKIIGFKHTPTLTAEGLKDKLRNTKPEAGVKNVIMLHQGIKQILPYAYSWQISQGDLPSGFDYYALGHFHTRMLQKFGNGMLGIAGSPEIIREEEIEGYEKKGKGAFLVDLSKDVNVQPINLDIRHQEVIAIDTNNFQQEINKIIDKMKSLNNKKKPILHLEINGKPSKQMLEYMNRLQSVVLHYRIIKYNVSETENELNVKVENTTVNELVREFLTKRGYSKEDADLLIEVINDVENEEKVNKTIKKIVGLVD